MASPEGQFNMNSVMDKIDVLHENLDPLFKKKKILLSEKEALIKRFAKLSQTYKNKQELGILNKLELKTLKDELKKLAGEGKRIKKELRDIENNIKEYFKEKTQN